jgi:hypothetical protein
MSKTGFPFFTNQESTNERYRLKDSQDRYSKPSYYTGTDSNTFRIPDNRNTFAVRSSGKFQVRSTKALRTRVEPGVGWAPPNVVRHKSCSREAGHESPLSPAKHSSV